MHAAIAASFRYLNTDKTGQVTAKRTASSIRTGSSNTGWLQRGGSGQRSRLCCVWKRARIRVVLIKVNHYGRAGVFVRAFRQIHNFGNEAIWKRSFDVLSHVWYGRAL